MNKLVTDDPQTNTEVMFNLAYVKDKEVWIRGGGDDGEDCTLIDFTNRMCASHDCLFDITPNEIDEEDIDNTGDRLLECSMSGCPIGTAYFIAIQAAELRERLRKYENEREPIKPQRNKLSPNDWFCGKCNKFVSRLWDYCPDCGKPIAWT